MDRKPSSSGSGEPRRIESIALFRDGNDVVTIVHAGQEYRLRVTKANKLILTK